MLLWALLFLSVSIVLAVLAFSGVAIAISFIAKILFFISLIFFLVFVVLIIAQKVKNASNSTPPDKL